MVGCGHPREFVHVAFSLYLYHVLNRGAANSLDRDVPYIAKLLSSARSESHAGIMGALVCILIARHVDLGKNSRAETSSSTSAARVATAVRYVRKERRLASLSA